MKLSLMFHVFNKEQTIAAVLRSWLDNVSGLHDLEIIPVLDDLRDQSDQVVLEMLDAYPYEVKPIYALNGWEMGCNNLALAIATGEITVFVQDDNYMHSPGWDHTLARVHEVVPDVGGIGLLAGLVWKSGTIYQRVECWGEHKGEMFTQFNIPKDRYQPGIWQVDCITRPMAYHTAVMRGLHGVDWAYWPMDWDETDLSWRAHLAGYKNVILPFDLYNHVGKKDTLGEQTMLQNFVRGRDIFQRRYANEIPARCLGGEAIQLAPLHRLDDGTFTL
jgi:hypothetical protein